MEIGVNCRSLGGGMIANAPRLAARKLASPWIALLVIVRSGCGANSFRDVLASPITSPSALVEPLMRNGRSAKCRPELTYLAPRAAAVILDEGQAGINCHYHLTVLIPAYNERQRIGDTLSSYTSCLSQTPVHCCHHAPRGEENAVPTSGSASILVVDDGSTDGTAEYVRGASWRRPVGGEDGCWKVDDDVTCISLPDNSGKGAAIERGMAELSLMRLDSNTSDPSLVRSVVLVADADGSGDISCIGDMLQNLEELISPNATPGDQALVVGYRQYPEAKSPLRALLSWGFRTCVSLIFLGSDLGVRDTQCGFKLMTTSTGEAHSFRLVQLEPILVEVPCVVHPEASWVKVSGRFASRFCKRF